MTVSVRPCRWRDACSVVVPMSIMTVWPSLISAAAAAPIASLAAERSISGWANGAGGARLPAVTVALTVLPSLVIVTTSFWLLASLRAALTDTLTVPRALRVTDFLVFCRRTDARTLLLLDVAPTSLMVHLAVL